VDTGTLASRTGQFGRGGDRVRFGVKVVEIDEGVTIDQCPTSLMRFHVTVHSKCIMVR
jgi:hypothetical protein